MPFGGRCRAWPSSSVTSNASGVGADHRLLHLSGVIFRTGSLPAAWHVYSGLATLPTGIFLPGVLIALAGLPVWLWLGHHPAARGALVGINAAVVGVLGAALYNPIWVSAVSNGRALRLPWLVFCSWNVGGFRRSPL